MDSKANFNCLTSHGTLSGKFGRQCITSFSFNFLLQAICLKRISWNLFFPVFFHVLISQHWSIRTCWWAQGSCRWSFWWLKTFHVSSCSSIFHMSLQLRSYRKDQHTRPQMLAYRVIQETTRDMWWWQFLWTSPQKVQYQYWGLYSFIHV